MRGSVLRLASFATILIIGATVIGCDAFFETTIENRQSREVRLLVEGRGWGWVRACTVDTVDPAPFAPGQPVDVQINDAGGQVIVEYTVLPAGDQSNRMPSARVIVPERLPGECSSLDVTSWRARATATAVASTSGTSATRE